MNVLTTLQVSHLPASGGDNETVHQQEPDHPHEPANESDDEFVEQDEPVGYHEPFVDDDDDQFVNYQDRDDYYEPANDSELTIHHELGSNDEPSEHHESTEHANVYKLANLFDQPRFCPEPDHYPHTWRCWHNAEKHQSLKDLKDLINKKRGKQQAGDDSSDIERHRPFRTTSAF